VYFFAKMTEGRSKFVLLSMVALLGCSIFLTQASASPWHGALDHLIQAQNESNEVDQSASLHSALTDLKMTRMPPRDMIAHCIALVQAAISDLERHDHEQATRDIALAMDEVRKDVAPRLIAPQPSTPSPFPGTWIASSTPKGTSTLNFTADGKWTEDWSEHHLEGKWQADSDNTGVTVQNDDTREQFHILHYRLDANHHRAPTRR